MAHWTRTETLYQGLQGPCLTSWFRTQWGAKRELAKIGFLKVRSPTTTAKGLAWERKTSGTGTRAFALIDIGHQDKKKGWEITIVFWDESGERVLDIPSTLISGSIS